MGNALMQDVPQAHEPLVTVGSRLELRDFSVRLEFFQGPMDLLLHLVSRQEVPVEQVKMALIAEQYLHIVMANAESLDLDKAGEYLVIASTLLAIKSSALLPAEKEIESEEPSDWAEGNAFFEDLRSRLIAYQETQERASLLRELPQLDVDTFSRRDKKLLLPTPEMLQEPEDVFSLGQLFVGLLKRIGAVQTFRIAAQPFAVVDFMVSIVDSLSQTRKEMQRRGAETGRAVMSFPSLLKLLRSNSRKGSNRTVVIGGFIAVLELMKRGLIAARLDDQQQVEVSLAIEDAATEGLEMSSEFDEQAPTSPSVEEQQLVAADTMGSERVVKMDDYRQRDLRDVNGLVTDPEAIEQSASLQQGVGK